MGKDVPLHDPNGAVVTGSIFLQVHKVPLKPGWPFLQNHLTFLQQILGIDGIQLGRVQLLQAVLVLGHGTAAQRLGKRAVEPAGTVSHGTHWKGKAGVRDVHCDASHRSGALGTTLLQHQQFVVYAGACINPR